jgi:putative effector of murein hydrolase LrgA (UPF0299 family)
MDAGSTIPMGNYILYLVLIMLGSGIVGGLANYLVNSKEKFSWRDLSGYVLLGVVASFVVPLFLNMISSGLLADAQNNPITLLVITSFCLIAAVFSKSFLENVYNKLVQEVEKVKKDMEEEKEAHSDQAASAGDAKRVQVATVAALDPAAKNIIGVMQDGKYIFRTPEGLQKETSLPLPKINEAIQQLIDKNIVKQTTGKNNKELMYLSPLGKNLKLEK